MAYANDMTSLINKIERRLGLLALTPHLPKELSKDKWGEVIQDDTMVTFSRYFPQKVKFVVNEETCYVKKEADGKKWFIIKDEYMPQKLLGAIDIAWDDLSSNNISVGQTAGYGYYIPNYGGMESTFDAFLSAQMNADVASLYNNQLYLDFKYPNKLRIERAGGIDVSLSRYVVYLLVQHTNLQTISPTMMNIFEDLAQADVANFLFMNLRYYDQLDTIYVNIDLKLSELEQAANKRQDVIDKLEQAYVSASNDAIPYIMTVNG